MMLTKEEEGFIQYWEKNREKQKKAVRQFLIGIPLGLLIVIPTVISLTSGWYKRAEMEANSSDFDPKVLFVALLLIVGFGSVFYSKWRWEQYDQRYRELVAKRDRGASPGGGAGARDLGAGSGLGEGGSGLGEGESGLEGAPPAGKVDPEEGENRGN
ncbi:MAG: hypothetical protein JST68_02080 [Bacteroidetes bacterium]|nr:hypothetical protein [Bacteroidota bacterium]